ncbi:hypothetical protein E3N88_05403 [Mikania micrantha]|uniref:Uncharacterized protein n=1 Tax=Mikania micrantha TaxID=192012 RepID=A0A5N6PN15_9ASTR|nr:hypothetical protein E3N88_05403 [Mikania micrantha]
MNLQKRTVIKKVSVPSSSRSPWKTAASVIDDEQVFLHKFGEYDGRIERMEKLVTAIECSSKDEFDRDFAREIVVKEIGKHVANGLGRLINGGAMVLKHSEAFNGSSRIMCWLSGNMRSDAVKVLQPRYQCLPLNETLVNEVDFNCKKGKLTQDPSFNLQIPRFENQGLHL